MDYVEAPDPYHGDKPTVFLAGGITGCPDWQAQAADMLAHTELALLNPRRRNFPIHDPRASFQQIEWEFNALNDADVILFWFPASKSVQPIAMYELGRHAVRNTRLFVGADPGYLRRQDVEIQLGLARGPSFHVWNSLASVCLAVEGIEHLLHGLPPRRRS